MKMADKIKVALDESLLSGGYEKLFLDDLINLVANQGISPEVILREIRVLEGKEIQLMGGFDIDPTVIFGNYQRNLNGEPSATKTFTEFKGKWLKGLYHKHYYIHQSDSASINIKNQQNEFPGTNPMAAMMTRIVEGRLTGEWIIFKKSNDRNTYFCLAKHADGDKAIHDRLVESGINLD